MKKQLEPNPVISFQAPAVVFVFVAGVEANQLIVSGRRNANDPRLFVGYCFLIRPGPNWPRAAAALRGRRW